MSKAYVAALQIVLDHGMFFREFAGMLMDRFFIRQKYFTLRH